VLNYVRLGVIDTAMLFIGYVDDGSLRSVLSGLIGCFGRIDTSGSFKTLGKITTSSLKFKNSKIAR